MDENDLPIWPFEASCSARRCPFQRLKNQLDDIIRIWEHMSTQTEEIKEYLVKKFLHGLLQYWSTHTKIEASNNWNSPMCNCGTNAPTAMLSVIAFFANVVQLTARPREISDSRRAGNICFGTGYGYLQNRKKFHEQRLNNQESLWILTAMRCANIGSNYQIAWPAA